MHCRYENWRRAHFLHHGHTAHETKEEYFAYTRMPQPTLGRLRTLLRWAPPLGLATMHFM
jgi:hypothetical protein